MKNERLVELRADLTLKQVAEDIGIPLSTYAMVEAGYRFPRKKLLVLISQHYGVTVDDLFFNNEDRSKIANKL